MEYFKPKSATETAVVSMQDKEAKDGNYKIATHKSTSTRLQKSDRKKRCP